MFCDWNHVSSQSACVQPIRNQPEAAFLVGMQIDHSTPISYRPYARKATWAVQVRQGGGVTLEAYSLFSGGLLTTMKSVSVHSLLELICTKTYTRFSTHMSPCDCSRPKACFLTATAFLTRDECRPSAQNWRQSRALKRKCLPIASAFSPLPDYYYYCSTDLLRHHYLPDLAMSMFLFWRRSHSCTVDHYTLQAVAKVHRNASIFIAG